MGRLSDWIIGIVLFVCLYLATIWLRADVIEDDVRAKTEQALNDSGYGWVQVDVDGRDVTLKAGTQSPADKVALAALTDAEDVWGVRVVNDAIDRSVPSVEGVDQNSVGTQGNASSQAAVAKPAEPDDSANAGDNGAKVVKEIALPPVMSEPAAEAKVQLTQELPKQSPAPSPAEPKPEPVKTAAAEPASNSAAEPAVNPAIVSEPVLKIDDKTADQNSGQKGDKVVPKVAVAAPKQNTGPLTPAECQDNIDIAVGNNIVRFGSGSSRISKNSFGLLNKVASIAKRCRTTRLEIAGHTDNTGTRQANIRLSRLRAESVVTYLIGKGVGPNRLIAQGFGSANPVANNSNEAGRARNRRIDFNVRR